MTFAADAPLSKRISFVTSDNTREGTYAADAIAEKMGGKGEYAVLENPGQTTTTSVSPPSSPVWRKNIRI